MNRAVPVILILACLAIPTFALEVMDASFVPDVSFPQYTPFWTDSTLPEPGLPKSLGGYVHVFVRNTSGATVSIEDVTLEGISLKRAIAFSDQRKFKRVAQAASVYFSDLPNADRDRLISLGEPVWWKVEPDSISPYACGEVIVRLRRTPPAKSLGMSVLSPDPTPVTVRIGDGRPRFESISFSRDLAQAYLYVRGAPSKVLMDGRDVTASCGIGHDSAVDVTPIVCALKSPLARASFHVFQVAYPDGSKVSAGIRAWNDGFAYGVWGGRPGKESEIEIGREYVNEIAAHNINVQMEMLGSDAVRAFMNSRDGRGLMKLLGVGRVVGDPDKWPDPCAYYIADEPDTADYRVEGVPSGSKVGSVAQGLIARASELRKTGPGVPNMLNVDMTFKPENWYTYAQLPDIFAADPYYQTRLSQVYWETPNRYPLFANCDFVYAVGSVCRSACAPKPLHLILNSTRVQKESRAFRYGTPEEKRLEVFYALASGAKGLSFWWYTPTSPTATGSNGCGSDEPGAKALWREIGLLGAEVRTLDPLVTRSCPASIPMTPSRGLGTRALLVGKDSLIILCTNENYLNDRLGTVIKPLENASVSITVPAWLDAKSVFEVSSSGTGRVSCDRSGLRLDLKLGTVGVTKLIVISSDADFRARLQKVYDIQFAENVRRLSGAT